MNRTRTFCGGMLCRLTFRLALCAALAALGLTAVYVADRFLGSAEPYVELSRSVQPLDAPVVQSGEDQRKLLFGVATMVSAKETFSTYYRLVQRISSEVGCEAGFVLPATYTDARHDLEEGKVHVALVCTGTYVYGSSEGRIELLVQPEFEEGLHYRSVLLVPAGSQAKNILDLREKVMAFTDPESNTGCLVPSVVLAEMKLDPRTFFRKVVFTGSHDRSILAVALMEVDGASVDSLVWHSKLHQDPALSRKVRLIWESEPFGPPPIVVPATLPAGLKNSLRRAFLGLDQDEKGREILEPLGIRRFVTPRPEDYNGVLRMYRRLQDRGAVKWP